MATLLCLNLRREHVADASEAARALQHAQALLQTHRRNGWPVLHAHTALPRVGAQGALPGFEPWPQEPVFALQRLSALDEPQLAEAMRRERVSVIGGAFSRLGLAALLAADECGRRLSIVSEACFAPAADVLPRGEILSLARTFDRARGAPHWVEMEPGGNVVCLETRRH